MSEHIVHVAIMEDCFNLLENANEICEQFKEVVKNERDFGVTASTTMSGDTYTTRLLEDIKSKWGNRSSEQKLEAKLAFVLGWTSHRAADRQMKPLFRETVDEQTRKVFGNECTYYHEAFMYKTYYQNKPGDPYAGVLQARPEDDEQLAGFKIDKTRRLFNDILKSSFMSMHTIKPLLTYSPDEAGEWIERIYERLQEFKIFTDRTAKIVACPEEEKMQKYIYLPNFFDPEDALIKAAMCIRDGKQITVEDITRAIDSTPRSHYAQALKMAVDYVIAASEFFEDKIDYNQLCDRFDIGKAGRDGMYV